MDERQSFIMYDVWAKYIVRLSDDCALQLARAICSYKLGLEIDIKDPTVAVIFESVKEQMDEDYKRYLKKCETNQRNRHKAMPSDKTVVDDGRRSSTVVDDGQRSGSDNDNEYDYDYDSDNISNSTTLTKTENLNNTSTSAVQKVVEEYNKTSFPKVQKLSDQRRKAVKARLNSFSLDEIIRGIQIAEASPFLHGNNNRNWKADFDWIMGVKSGGDQNLTRILEGAYSRDKTEEKVRSGTSTNRFHNFEQRNTDYDAIVAERMRNGTKKIDSG